MAKTIHPDHGLLAAKKVDSSIERSPEWPAVQKAHLNMQPNCIACKPGTHTNEGLQVHHIFPFHYCIELGRADLELDQRNLVTLCEKEEGHTAEDHHLLIGHYGDFKSSNLNVKDDATHTFYNMTEAQIRASTIWLSKKKSKLMPLDKMTQKEKDDLRALMDSNFPKS